MSAAPSWPLIFAALAGETFRSATAIAPGLNFDSLRRNQAQIQELNPQSVLQTFKTQNDARGARRTRPSKLLASRTEKARNLTVSQRLPPGALAPPLPTVCFPLPARYGMAIVEIRGLSPRIPTLSCVRQAPRQPAARILHVSPEARPRPCRPGAIQLALTELVMADPAIHVFGARSPDRRSAFASLVRGWN
jgi:hypothetical protein